jgi:hypothetical protein
MRAKQDHLFFVPAFEHALAKVGNLRVLIPMALAAVKQ